MKYLSNVRGYLSVLLLFLVVAPVVAARAEVVEISATFRSENLSSRNNFLDTTRSSGCPWGISMCSTAAVPRIAIPGIRYASSGGVPVDSEVGLRLPSANRSVSLVHEDGVSTSEMLFKVDGVGGTLPTPEMGLPSYWIGGGTFSAGITSCVGHSGGNSSKYMFFWGINASDTCTRRNARPMETVVMDDLFLRYKITPPNPANMKPGVYRGSVRYSVGSAREDIAFLPLGGRVTDNVLVINFTVTVPLMFRVDVPAGGQRVELTPQEGWANWLLRGRKLSRLVKHQTFNLWSNAPLTMRLECTSQIGDSCALQEKGGALAVPVNVSVNLPGNFTDSSNARVNNKVLSVSGMGADSFKPSGYIERQPGNLQFEVSEESVAEMLKRPGSNYSGTVTVVWESTI